MLFSQAEINELESRVRALPDASVPDAKIATGLDEMLTQAMCKLDGIECNGEADLRALRKRQIVRCEEISTLLQAARARTAK